MKIIKRQFKKTQYLEVKAAGNITDDIEDMSILVSRCLNMKVSRILLIFPDDIDIIEKYPRIGNHLIESFGSYGIRLAFLMNIDEISDIDNEEDPPYGRYIHWDIFKDRDKALKWLIK